MVNVTWQQKDFQRLNIPPSINNSFTLLKCNLSLLLQNSSEAWPICSVHGLSSQLYPPGNTGPGTMDHSSSKYFHKGVCVRVDGPLGRGIWHIVMNITMWWLLPDHINNHGRLYSGNIEFLNSRDRNDTERYMNLDTLVGVYFTKANLSELFLPNHNTRSCKLSPVINMMTSVHSTRS